MNSSCSTSSAGCAGQAVEKKKEGIFFPHYTVYSAPLCKRVTTSHLPVRFGRFVYNSNFQPTSSTHLHNNTTSQSCGNESVRMAQIKIHIYCFYILSRFFF